MSKPVKNEEAAAFARRLETLLLKKGKSLSPTALARDFNLRWRGVPLTVNATRKWLMGESIPTMDKITTLSSMLNTTSDWLRWGDVSLDVQTHQSYEQMFNLAKSGLREIGNSFTQDFLLLNSTNQKMVTAIMEILLESQRKPIEDVRLDIKHVKSTA